MPGENVRRILIVDDQPEILNAYRQSFGKGREDMTFALSGVDLGTSNITVGADGIEPAAPLFPRVDAPTAAA